MSEVSKEYVIRNAADEQAACCSRSTAVRCLYTGFGVLFVAIGFVGIALPGIPTTGPLILASFLLAKGNPRLERVLVRNRIFKRYLDYLDGSTVMPMKARIWSVVWMWGGIGISCFVFQRTFENPAIGSVPCVLAGLVGTVFIMRYRRTQRRLQSSVLSEELRASVEVEPMVTPAWDLRIDSPWQPPGMQMWSDYGSERPTEEAVTQEPEMV